MTVKVDARFKGELTRDLKNDTNNFVNFYASSWYSENLHFVELLLSKAYKDLGENVQKSYVKFEEKLTLGSKNDMTKLVNFSASSGKSESLHFRLLL